MRITFRVHAVQRMAKRRISTSDVADVVEHGDVIEDYPDDKPYPSRLILGDVGGRPLHVVAAFNRADDEAIIVTVYEPEAAKWEPGFRRRR